LERSLPLVASSRFKGDVALVIVEIILAVAVAGTIASTVVLVLSIVGAVKFLSSARRDRNNHERWAAKLPPVSVLKPVHGNEARLRENIESFFRQDYPEYEILFAADQADDTALPVIREICAHYPHIPSRILVTGDPPWPNAQNYCFHRLTGAATHDILVTSDSDVEVGPNYLRDIVPPLLDPQVGAVTCAFRGKSAGGFWAYLDAIGQSVEFTAGVLMSNLLESTKFGLGPTIAVRKDSIARIGGFAAVREYLSNDFVVGNFIYKAGFQVMLSSHFVDHISAPMTFRQMWERQLRWAMGTRYSRPKGHLGTGLTFAVPYGILGLLAAIALDQPLLGSSLLAAALLNRMVQCWVVGWWTARDPVARRTVLLYPLRDLHGFVVWCASYIFKRSLWRDNKYELLKGGRLVALRANGAVLRPDLIEAAAQSRTAGSER
jgi:ceramide glucosyltransferase